MSQTPLSLPQQRKMGQTSRKDAWWLQPLVVFLGLSAFIIYANWAAFQASNYEHGAYLSPMYSPLLFEAPTQAAIKAETLGADAHMSHHSWFGAWPSALQPSWVPGWMLSPALIILIFPAGFRLTCYYYRGAYYKAFWADPINCAVGEPRNSFRGENFWPLLIQNIHRYFFYAAAVYIFILAYDAWVALWHAPAGTNLSYNEAAATGQLEFGLGVGTLVLTLNVILLGGYTFGCHCARHFAGGKHDHLSKVPTGKKAYECVSCLNRNHMKWAWTSLIWVGFTDFYIRMCAMGIWSDWRLF